MRRRLVILTEIIAPYRIPVFNVLARHPEIDLHVIFLAESDPGLREWQVYKDEIQFSFQVLPSWRQRVAGHKFLLHRGMKEALRGANIVRRLQLSGGVAGAALGGQESNPVHGVGGKHRAGFSQPQASSRISEKEVHEAMLCFRCPREVVVAVRYELWNL
jgi:hypothetical protein